MTAVSTTLVYEHHTFSIFISVAIFLDTVYKNPILTSLCVKALLMFAVGTEKLQVYGSKAFCNLQIVICSPQTTFIVLSLTSVNYYKEVQVLRKPLLSVSEGLLALLVQVDSNGNTLKMAFKIKASLKWINIIYIVIFSVDDMRVSNKLDVACTNAQFSPNPLIANWHKVWW